jgi:ATP-binding cassette, subfamily F, member 3
MLHLRNITYRIDGRELFTGATAVVPAGKRVALFGQNGSGKTTLLRMIQGEITPDSGEINLRPRATMAAIAQEAPGGEQSLLDTVLASNTRLGALNEAASMESDPEKIAEIHIALADMEAHTAPARAASILAGLGFNEAAQARPCSSYSGGWRMRVALASSLFNQPDLLLLDEPTNYLDLEGVIWLESFLKSYPYTILIVSHDRDLLNRAVDGILHLHDGKLSYYPGNYDNFEDRRRMELERVSAMKSKQEAERRHMQKFVDRFRYQANKARQAQSRLKMLARLKPIVSIGEETTQPFTFPNPEPMAPPLVSLEDASVGYTPGEPVLEGLDLYLDMEDRIAFLGQNGNGKSTLAKLLAGRLKAEAGTVQKSKKLKIGYFAQHQLDELRPKESPLQHLEHLMPGQPPTRLRARLGAFGFGVDKADRAVETLSGGEKARLLLALMSFDAPHIMILDEPTNHLDVNSREALIHALNQYEGALILITHDRHIIDACVNRLLLIDKGTLQRFDGDIDDYKRHLLNQRRALASDNRAAKSEAKQLNRKAARKASADARQKISSLKKATAAAEDMVIKLTSELDVVDTLLGDPKLYENDGDSGDIVTRLQKEKATLAAQLKKAEAAWLNAAEVYEQAKAGEALGA